jgi:hypothetical protein
MNGTAIGLLVITAFLVLALVALLWPSPAMTAQRRDRPSATRTCHPAARAWAQRAWKELDRLEAAAGDERGQRP